MRFFALMFALFLQVSATTLVGYNVYEREGRVDVMLSFDAPYMGQIYSKRSDGATSLVLGGLSFSQPISKQLTGSVAKELLITPNKDSIIITLLSQAPVSLSASRTTDGFGLRIRAAIEGASLGALTPAQSPAQPTTTKQAPVQDDEGFVSWRYILVVGFLIALFVILLLVRRFGISRNRLPGFAKKAAFLDKLELKHGVETIYERALDAQNRVVLLEYNSRQYLILVGTTNIMLDRFGSNISSEDEFSVFFEENKRRIQAMIDEKGGLNSYKDKLNTLA